MKQMVKKTYKTYDMKKGGLIMNKQIYDENHENRGKRSF